jgi:hypothetical protein
LSIGLHQSKFIQHPEQSEQHAPAPPFFGNFTRPLSVEKDAINLVRQRSTSISLKKGKLVLAPVRADLLKRYNREKEPASSVISAKSK